MNKDQIEEIVDSVLKTWTVDISTQQQEIGEKMIALRDLTEIEMEEISKLEEKAKIKSDSVLKMLIGGMCAQFLVLGHITYGYPGLEMIPGGFGWDVGEPIAYLIAIGLETLGLWYWLRRSAPLTQSTIHGINLNTKLNSAFAQVRTNRAADIATMKSRLDSLKKKYRLLG